MADRFFDTSAVVKHYRVEQSTANVDAYLAEASSRHFISDLNIVEWHSVFARLVRTGQIAAADFHLARGRFHADIVAGLWQVITVTAAHYHQAEQLLVQHGLGQGLRTLDALQLAVAMLFAFGPLDAFVCADVILCQIAAMEGLTVVNPELP